MSIKNLVIELETIGLEIKSLAARKKQLTQKKKDLELQIQNFLRSRQQSGLKHQGTAILLEEKEKRLNKPKKQQTDDALTILRRYGINSPDRVLNEILEARKGQPVQQTHLRIKKYQEKN